MVYLMSSFKRNQNTERCRLPYENSTSNYLLSDEILKKHFPINPRTQTYSQCYMFNDNHQQVDCSDYIFDESIYEQTTIVEWNMVCSRAFMSAIADSCFMVGIMIGSLISGQLSDRFGRKKVLYFNMIAQFILGIIISLNKYYAAFAVARIFMGAVVSGGMLTAFVMGTEMVGPNDRVYAGIICHCFFAIGYMLVALYAYFLRHWRYLVGAITAPGIIFFAYWFILPESPRWLLAHNKTQRAGKIIKKMARINRKVLNDQQLSDFLDGAKADDDDADESNGTISKKTTIIDICRYPKLRRRSMIIFTDWFAITLSYYGISWNTSNLGGDDFLNFFIAGTVELPAYLLLLLTLNRWGRKVLLCGSMISGAIFLISIAAIPADMNWLIVILAMIGKFAVAASFSVIYIFTVEQYPTVIRSAGLGAASTIARCGAILVPFINATSEYWKPIPMLLYGVCILIGAGLSLTLPETLNKKLPETIEDGENF